MIFRLFLVSALLNMPNAYSTVVHAHPITDCSQEAQELGKLQTPFLDPLDRGFIHPGVYTDSTAVSDQAIAELITQLSTKLPRTHPEFLETLGMISGVFSFDGEVHILSKGQQKRFEKVLADIEKTGIGRQIVNMSPITVLHYLTQWAKSLNDLSDFGIPPSPGQFRDSPVIIRKGWGTDNAFHSIDKMRSTLAKNPEDLKTYNMLVNDVTRLYKQHNGGEAVFPSGNDYKNYWGHTIAAVLNAPTKPTSAKFNFVSKHYRLINTSAKEIEKQMLDMLENIRTLLAQSHSPIKVAAYAHQRTIDIHPFSDGNGRIARLLMNMVLRSADYPSISIMSDKEYTQAILQALEPSGEGVFEEYLSRRVCSKTQQWKKERELYGQDIAKLAKTCQQAARQYYLPTTAEQAFNKERLVKAKNPIKECKESFATLVNSYQNPINICKTTSNQATCSE